MALASLSVAPGPHCLPYFSVSPSFGFTPQQLLGLRQIQNSAISWFQAMRRGVKKGIVSACEEEAQELITVLWVVPQPCCLGPCLQPCGFVPDVDECAAETPPCSNVQYCENVNGSYTCEGDWSVGTCHSPYDFSVFLQHMRLGWPLKGLLQKLGSGDINSRQKNHTSLSLHVCTS